MADPVISTAKMFETIGRLYVEVRARAEHEAELERELSAATNPVSGVVPYREKGQRSG